MKSDLEIQKDVMDEISWDPFLDPSEIGVAVKDGIVTLSGQVNSFFKKTTVEKAVRRVKGVKAIAEDIQIGVSPLSNRSDTDLAEAVLNALEWHCAVPENNIQVKVENGFVQLDDVENAAWAAPGVLNVDSKLQIDSPEYAFYK